jgi:hypothetical protein
MAGSILDFEVRLLDALTTIGHFTSWWLNGVQGGPYVSLRSGSTDVLQGTLSDGVA